MANEYIPSYQGYVALQKTGGVGYPATPAVQYGFAAARIIPVNVLANMYPGVIGASSYPTVAYAGKKRAGYTIFAYCQPPKTGASNIVYGMDAALFNALLFNLSGSPAATDKWSAKMYNTLQTRTWDWGRCSHVVIQGSGSGGGVVVQMGFLSRWGESEAPFGTTLPDGEAVPAAPTWFTPTAAELAGELDDVTDYDFRSDTKSAGSAGAGTFTADQVRSFTLHLVRGQGYVDYLDNTRSPKEIATGGFTGGLTLEQNPVASSIPSVSSTLRLHSNQGAAYTKAVKFALLLKEDSHDQPMDAGIETRVTNYTLYDQSAGGNPATCSAFTLT